MSTEKDPSDVLPVVPDIVIGVVSVTTSMAWYSNTKESVLVTQSVKAISTISLESVVRS